MADESLQELKDELAFLRTLALPMMHHCKGDYNSRYRGKKNAPTYEQAGKLLSEYFKRKPIE